MSTRDEKKLLKGIEYVRGVFETMVEKMEAQLKDLEERAAYLSEEGEDEPEVWRCDFCGEGFDTLKQAEKHEAKCDKNPENAEAEAEAEDEGEDDFWSCDYCGKKFSTERKAARHEENCPDRPEEDEDAESGESSEGSEDVPDCFGEHGNPVKGLKCPKCDYEEPCKEATPDEEPRKSRSGKGEAPPSEKPKSGAPRFLKKGDIEKELKKSTGLKEYSFVGFNTTREDQAQNLDVLLKTLKKGKIPHESYKQGFMTYVLHGTLSEKKPKDTPKPAPKKSKTEKVPVIKAKTAEPKLSAEDETALKDLDGQARSLVLDIANSKGISIPEAREALGL